MPSIPNACGLWISGAIQRMEPAWVDVWVAEVASANPARPKSANWTCHWSSTKIFVWLIQSTRAESSWRNNLHPEGRRELYFVSVDTRDLGRFRKANDDCELQPSQFQLRWDLRVGKCWLIWGHPYARCTSKWYRVASTEKPWKASEQKSPSRCHKAATHTGVSGSATEGLLYKISKGMELSW